MKNCLYTLILFLIAVLSSCSPYQNSVYFQGLNRNSDLSHKIDNFAPLVIQVGDVLSVNVKSLNQEGSALFNTTGGATTGSSASGTGSSTANPVASGYTVDQNGEIQLPLVHGVKVLGLTIAQAQSAIQKVITPFLKEPTVSVQLLNFKITVLGDVGHPDVFPVSGDNITILKALSIAGDLTITGKRDNVLLIREINGERKFVNIDLTSPKLFDSPYYYLKNNDVIYVEAGRSKFTANSSVKQNLPILLSIVSIILIAIQVSRKK